MVGLAVFALSAVVDEVFGLRGLLVFSVLVLLGPILILELMRRRGYQFGHVDP